MAAALGPDALLDVLMGGGRVLLTGPVAPDGDSIGAALGLQRVLQRHGVDCDVAGCISFRYKWMPGAHRMLPDTEVRPGYRAVVVLDGDRNRLTAQAQVAFQAAAIKGIIDHHASTRPDGYTHAWLSPDTASTCEMVYELLSARREAIDADLAALLYAGSVFDTGGFRHSNTTPETLRMAAALMATGIDHTAICARVLMERRVPGLRLTAEIYGSAQFYADGSIVVGKVTQGARKRLSLVDGDSEGVVDALVHTQGVEVAVLIIERDDGTVKYSLRSRGNVDLVAVARELSPTGGGHRKAAGASTRCSVEVAESLVVRTLSAHLAIAAAS